MDFALPIGIGYPAAECQVVIAVGVMLKGLLGNDSVVVIVKI